MTKEPKIYNYVSSVESPLLWGTYIKEMHHCYREVPPLRSMWYIFYIFYTTLWVGKILRFVLHRVPAAFMDILLIFFGKNPKWALRFITMFVFWWSIVFLNAFDYLSRMLKLYAKTDHLLDSLYVFTTRQWKFDNSNTRELWFSLSQEDRSTFFYSLEGFDWKTYIKSYFYGIRRHLIKEDLSNIEKASAKNRKYVITYCQYFFNRVRMRCILLIYCFRLFWLHQMCIVFIVYLIFKIGWMSIRRFF